MALGGIGVGLWLRPPVQEKPAGVPVKKYPLAPHETAPLKTSVPPASPAVAKPAVPPAGSQGTHPSVSNKPAEARAVVPAASSAAPVPLNNTKPSAVVSTNVQPKPRAAPAKPKSKPAVKGKSSRGPDNAGEKVFEPFRSGLPIKVSQDVDANLSVQTTKIEGADALEMDYNFWGGRWVRVSVELNGDFSRYEMLQFQLTGEGKSNTFDVIIEDADGTQQGFSWAKKTNHWPWVPMGVSLGALKTLAPGGVGGMDWAHIRRVSFQVSVHPEGGDEGGRGRVLLRDVRFIPASGG